MGKRALGKKKPAAPLRLGTRRTQEGKASAYQRCPSCKKLRMRFWPSANWAKKESLVRKIRNTDWPAMVMDRWTKLDDGTWICHICVDRSMATPLNLEAASIHSK